MNKIKNNFILGARPYYVIIAIIAIWSFLFCSVAVAFEKSGTHFISLRPRPSDERPMPSRHIRIDQKANAFTQIVQGYFSERGYEVDSNSLGHGWYSVVYKAREISTGHTVAIRIANPYGPLGIDTIRAYCSGGQDKTERWQNLGVIGRAFSGIVQIYEVGSISVADLERCKVAYVPIATSASERIDAKLRWPYPYQIMEFFDGQSCKFLYDNNLFMSMDLVKLIEGMIELTNDINQFHAEGLVYGEITHKNVIINKNVKFKLCDPDTFDRATPWMIREDRSCLFSLIWLILFQASRTTDNSVIIDDFLSIWNIDVASDRPLTDLAKDLAKLKVAIIERRAFASGRANVGESNILRPLAMVERI